MSEYNPNKHPVLSDIAIMIKGCLLCVVGLFVLGLLICIFTYSPDDSYTNDSENTSYETSSSEDNSGEVTKDEDPLVTDTSRAIPYGNVPVYFETQNPFRESEYAQFINQPQVLLNYGSAIYVCDGTGNNDCTENYGVQDSNRPTFNDVGGYSKGDGSNRIYIHKLTEGARSASWYQDTLTHELGHEYDNANGVTKMDTWVQLYQQNPTAISDYGGNNKYEFFAEACSMYFNHPNDMQTQARLPVYNAMQDIFHYYN